MTERVKVVVRIRPFIASDPADAELNTIVLDQTHVSVGSNRVFKVDRVYMMEDDTEHIYAESVAPLVARFLAGFNASVLAYGQTGTGKTFTVQAMLPLLLSDVLQEMAAQQPGEAQSSAPAAPLLHLRYVEVYGESIRDLLDDAVSARRDGEAPLKLRLVTTTTTGGTRAVSPSSDDEGDAAAAATTTMAATGCTLVGATVIPIFTMTQAASHIARGDARRATGATNVHEHSSRSHAILTLFHPRLTCRLDIVDLAGSEREKKTGNVGLRFQESIGINTGLLALGNVIRALSRISRAAAARESAVKPRAPLLQRAPQPQPPTPSAAPLQQQHVPYRSSRLTRLLQDTLGGNSAALFIACVAPDTHNRDETLRTLQYCSLALRVLNEPLQQYERLRRAQSPLGRRHGSPLSGGVSPLSLRADGGDAQARHFAGDDEDFEDADPIARTASGAAVQLREWASAYAALQQQYDEQAELLAAVSAAHASAKERLALCERELRKDEGVFTQQIRQVQQLVAENQKLRRRLAKATLPTATHAASPPPHRHRRASTLNHDDTNALRDVLLARTRAALDGAAGAGGGAAALDHAYSKTPALGAARPPLSAHSPHRPPTAKGGADSAPYVPLEDLHDDAPLRAGVRARAAGSEGGGGGDDTPPTAALLHGYAAAGAAHQLGGADGAGGRAASTAAQEPVQSFIRHILGLNGIQADLNSAAAARSGAGGGGGVGTAGISLQSSIVKSAATSAAVGRTAASPQEAATRTPRVAVDAATPLLPMPSPDAEAAASPMLTLAAELLRYQGTNAELRNHVQRLQAELDGKARSEALLRLELQDMKELYGTA